MQREREKEKKREEFINSTVVGILLSSVPGRQSKNWLIKIKTVSLNKNFNLKMKKLLFKDHRWHGSEL